MSVVRIISMLLFIVFFSLLIAAGHFYIWHRYFDATGLSPLARRWGAVGLGALAFTIPLGFVLSRTLPWNLGSKVAAIAFVWLGFAFLLGSFTALTEPIRALSSLFFSNVDETSNERRLFLSRALASTAGLFSLGFGASGVAHVMNDVMVARVKVLLPRFPSSLNGLRLVQISDVHIGPTLGHKWLSDVVRQINELNPDIVAITGDLVDGSVESLKEHVSPLANIQSRYGVYFVTGNHEYYSGADAWIQYLESINIRVLRNESVLIGDDNSGFHLAGVDDWSAHRFGRGHGSNLEQALRNIAPHHEVILMAHQPKQIFQAAERKVGLQISGHTHGGQIFPWMYLVRLDQPFIAGLHRFKDTQIYVSRGTGYWGPPMRIGAPAEISLIEISTGDPNIASEQLS